MDAMTGLLDGPRAREAFLLRATFASPFALRVCDEAPLTVMAVARGAAWLVASGIRHRLAPGDLALVRGPDPYLVADDPERDPQAVILPGQVCTAPNGGASTMGWIGPRTWGNAAHGDVELLIGSYSVAREISQRVLHALPPALVLGADEWHCPLLPVLGDEVGKDLPGQGAVLDRLLDVLVVSAVRAWLASTATPGWYCAYDDPVAGPALRLMQDAPERPWTVARLADEAGVSRATFARHFAAVVGQAPIAFLTDWRLSLAADLLRETSDTVESIARRAGYGSAFALSTAFKRVHGQSPRAYRTEARRR